MPVAALAGAACSIEPVGPPGARGEIPVALSPATSVEAEVEARMATRKSLAARVLAANALERVTGRRADPGRLAALN
jgi:hypothetical protein